MTDFEVLRAAEDEAEETTDVVEVEGGRIIFEPGQSDDTAIKLDIEPEKKSFALKEFLEGMALSALIAGGIALGKKIGDGYKDHKEKKAKKKQDMEKFEKWQKAQAEKEKSDAVDVNYEDVEAEKTETEAKDEKTETEKEQEQPKNNKKK